MLIWIASYPRSGNTLLRLILFHAFGLRTCSLYNDPSDIGSRKEFSDAVGHASLPPGWTPEAARSEDRLWLVKTHHPPTDDSKAIYILRDGRESSLSYLHYRNQHDAEKATLADIISGNVTFGSWSDHLRSWNPTQRPNTLLLKFEELAANPLSYLPQIASFLGVQPVGTEIPSFATLQAVNPAFFRSGRTNSWQEAFDDAHHLLFWLLHHEAMFQHGYRGFIPEPFRSAPPEALNQLGAAARNGLQYLLQKKNEHLWKREWELNEAFRKAETHCADLERHLNCRLAALEAAHQALQDKLDAMENSRSWKLTRPLRKIRRALR